MRIVKRLPTIANVAAGNSIVLNCPVRLTYEKIVLKLGGTFTDAQLENISIKVNGKEIQRYSDGDELTQINSYYDRGDTAGYLTLHFNRMELDSLGWKRVTGLGTADIQSLTIEADINAGATSPTLEAHAVLRQAEPMGLIAKIKRFPVTFSTSGKQDIDNLPQGARIACLHLFKADISAVEVEVNGTLVYDVSKALGEVLQNEAGRTAQTAVATHVDFLMDGDLAQALVTDQQSVADFRIRPTIGTSGQVTVVVEYLDQFAGI